MPFTLVALLASTALIPQAEPARELDRFLKRFIGFADSDIQALDRGQVVVKMLKTDLDREIAVFGAVWIDAPPSLYVERSKDIESFEKGGGFLLTKAVSSPPTLENFDALQISDEDLKDLRNCKLGDCEIKVSAPLLERLQTEVKWNAPDHRQKVNAILSQAALDYFLAYQRGGNQELAIYRDQKRPTFIAEEFGSMVEKSDFLPIYLPEFHRYLLDYPKATLPGATDVFYWQTVDFGLKPVTRLNHLTVYRAPLDVEAYAVASKQLYANHYFHTALELRFLIRDRRRPEAAGFYFLNLNRSRSDGLTGFTGALLGRTIRNKTRDGMETAMAAVKKRMEEDYRQRNR